MLGLLTSAFAVTNGIGQFATGFLADRWGARRLMTAGVGTYAAMNALIASAASAAWLLVWRSLAGFGGGAMIVGERIYVVEVTHPTRRAFANSVISAAQSAGTVAGPAVGGLIAAVADLRAPFLLVAATSAVAFVLTIFLPARPATEARPHADEAEVEIHLAPIAALLVANLALMASYGGFITTYAPLATTRLGWSTLDVGIAFSFFGAGSILFGPWLGHLADRYGRRRVAVLATLPISAFATAMVAGFPQLGIFALAVAAGAGLTAFSASWYAMLADASGARRRGRVFGVVSAISNSGIVLGAMLAAQLWERVDIGVAMLSAAVTILIAGAVLATFRPTRPSAPSAVLTGAPAEAPAD